MKWQSVEAYRPIKGEFKFLFISPILKATYRETPVHLEEAPGHLESLYEGFDVLNLFPNKADGPFHLPVEKRVSHQNQNINSVFQKGLRIL